MNPRLNEGVYVFALVPKGTDLVLLDPIATFREDEGISVVVEESHLERSKIEILFRAAWITLTVNSDLNAVGLTASVARALADKGISCNVIAGAYHDHLFVPVELISEAMNALTGLESMQHLSDE